MMKCGHCYKINNNYRYCEGCGRELVAVTVEKYEPLPEGSTKFLEEAVFAVESIFFPENVTSRQLDISSTALNLNEIVKDAGIYIIDEMQWQDIGDSEKKRCFFSDVFLTFVLSLIFVSIATAVSAFSFLTFFKLWISGFIFVSFVLWVIFPFLTGATVFSLSVFKTGLFRDKNNSVKGSMYPLILLFLFVQLYVFLPFLNLL